MAFKVRWWLWLSLAALMIGAALFRDIRKVGAHRMQDLRNRVVGARLVADGRLPYFYRWKPGDPVRYYDPENADASGRRLDTLSTITATPLFHHLMEPLAELPQSALARVWLGLEYAGWAVLVTLLLPLAVTPRRKLAVVAGALAFLFSMPWKVQVEEGQYYFLIPLLAALGYRLLLAKPSLWTGIATGLVAIVMVGIRPNTALFFLPFLLAAGRFSIPFRAALGATMVILVAGMAASPFERGLWQQYLEAVPCHIRAHLAGKPFFASYPDPGLPTWEGIDQFTKSPLDVPTSNEKGNFFFLYHRFFHRSIGPGGLSLFALASLALPCILFLAKNYRRRNIPLVQLALFGYCLYMITDLFSPVTRWLYYSVQWLFPLLLVLACYPSRRKGFYTLLLVGLALLIIDIRFTSYEHTAGDYLLLAALLLLAVVPGDIDTLNPLPAGVSGDDPTQDRRRTGLPI